MTMTKNEICRNYRESKDKPEQIKILADLNCTSMAEIEKILTDHGEKVEQSPKSNRGKKASGKNEVVAMPVLVEEILHAELEKLEEQMKPLEAQLKPLTEKYEEIANFMKSYGGSKCQ